VHLGEVDLGRQPSGSNIAIVSSCAIGREGERPALEYDGGRGSWAEGSVVCMLSHVV
jgi:hypothetical protein